MNDAKKALSISLSIGDELLDAVTQAGRTKALPVTFEDESGVRSINIPVDAETPAPPPAPLRLVR